MLSNSILLHTEPVWFSAQVPVEVLGIIFDEEDKTEAIAGDNVKVKLRGIEEEVSYKHDFVVGGIEGNLKRARFHF